MSSLLDSQPVLDRESTVDRRLVHVKALSEIFIADSVREDDTTFAASFQLPRTHGLWGDRQPAYHDPVVTLEVGRQTVFLVLHHYLKVSGDWKFVLRRIDFQVRDLEAYRDDHVHPPEGIARIRLLDHQQSHGIIESTFDGEAMIGDRHAMTMRADITVCSPYNFTLLRAKGRGRKPIDSAPLRLDAAPLPPPAVGRLDVRNVVVYHHGDDHQPGDYGLIVNQAHPAFFDHPHDHVTGSLILELFRQSALAVTRESDLLSAQAVVTACRMSFAEFAELDSETTSRAEVKRVTGTGDVLVGLSLHQYGETIAEADLLLSDPPGPARGDGVP